MPGNCALLELWAQGLACLGMAMGSVAGLILQGTESRKKSGLSLENPLIAMYM